MDKGLGQAECHGLGTEWAVLTNEVSEVESRKYLQERQAGLGKAGRGACPSHPNSWGPQRFSVHRGCQPKGLGSTLYPLMGLESP